MKIIHKYLSWLFLLCLVFTVTLGQEVNVQAASGKTIKTVSVGIAGKKVKGKTVSLQQGSSTVLKISTSPKLSQKKISYKSSKPSVVSVSKKGKLSALKTGTSKISITVKSKGYKSKTATLKVKVSSKDSGKTLVVYFSCTNTTKGVAEKIAAITNADIYGIQAKETYTDADLDYSPSRSAREQSNSSARPAIAGKIDGFDDYQVIYLGYPIWSDEEPRIIDTFLESYNFSGKTIIPFCTSGGSGIETSVSNIKKLVPNNTTILKGKRFNGNVTKEKIEEWINSLEL